MRKYLLALSLMFAASNAMAADWQFNKTDNYAMQKSGDDYFMLFCYHEGISMEYANSKEMKCSDTLECSSAVDYDAQGNQPITLTTDAGSMQLTRAGTRKTTIPLGFLDLSTYQGEKDEAELGAFAKTKKLELSFPAISRTVTFDNIQNGKELAAFFQTCEDEAVAFEKSQSELRQKLKEQEKQKQEQEQEQEKKQ